MAKRRTSPNGNSGTETVTLVVVMVEVVVLEVLEWEVVEWEVVELEVVVVVQETVVGGLPT
jgi:hypothetical protein